MNLFKSLVFHSTKGVSLVPSIREDVERNLTADGKRKSIVREFFLESLDKFRAIALLLDCGISTCSFPITHT